MRTRCAILLITLFLSAVAAGQELSGTVTNGTTGKVAAGDDVVLLSLSQGMQEAARTKADAQGRFHFKSDGQGPHLVRVNHQNVNYFGIAPPGTTSVNVKVYEAAAKVEGITGNVDILRLQTDGGNLQAVELYVVKNASNPPKTLMGDRPFEFYLPAGAQLDQTAAQSPGGNPVNVSAVPEGSDGRHYVVFPIRPGETQFQIAYHMPYAGQAKIEPRVTVPYDHMAVMLPKSMQFTSDTPGIYAPMNDETGATLQVATALTPGKAVPFSISGTGTLQDSVAGGQQQSPTPGRDMGPGGGLGAPIDTPDPLYGYRWPVLGSLTALLVAGGVYIATRRRPAMAVAATAAPVVVTSTPRAAVANRGATLLDALKEELFQLELDRQQGRITPEEYEKAKAALDVTLRRAMARKA